MLTPMINKQGKEPIYMQIRHFIVKAINEGHISKGEQMPSVRGFAKHLGLSCTTIENAYSQLMAEGYIDSRPGKGYFVEDIEGQREAYNQKPVYKKGQEKNTYKYDFASEYIAMDAFDFKVWKRHVNSVLNYDQEDLCAYGQPKGEVVLREAISRHFYRSRGVKANVDQIIIGGGVTPLLAMLSNLLQSIGIDELSLENPGFRKAYGVFVANGMKVSSLDVSIDGVATASLHEKTSRACYVSPSHHFPTGYIMPVKDRQNILRWATEKDGYIIEDDYNFELRFEGQPIPAMQGMDLEERVIYLGSFSTVLAPAIRLSFMVLPKGLNDLFEENEGMFPQTASKIEQLALAKFINSGDFDKHVRKIRHLYTKKQQDVLRYISRYVPEDFKPMKVKSGLQVMLKLPDNIEEKAFVEACREQGVKVEGLSLFCRPPYKSEDGYIVVGYRGIDQEALEFGIKVMGQVARALDDK